MITEGYWATTASGIPMVVFAHQTGRGPRRHIPSEYAGLVQREDLFGLTLCGRPAASPTLRIADESDLPQATCRTCQKAWQGC